MQKGIIKLKNSPSIVSYASIGGKKESEGPLAGGFDLLDTTDRFDAETWEKSESEMQKRALTYAMQKRGFAAQDVDALFAGDLMNQCTSSAYGLLSFDVPFFGLYGACSTAVEGLILSSLLLDTGHFNRTAAVASSHFYSSERQFRYPIEYGGVRAPTAQWTVTGAGAFILENGGKGVRVSEVLPGKTQDKGITDLNNMGAAMAPAAIDTLTRYFSESGYTPDDFDLIATGDLGYEGYKIVTEFMRDKGFTADTPYNDCGLMIFDREAQDVHAGGSGCGCSATVLAAHILPAIESGRLNHVLLIGTGALMSPASVQQGLSIPGIGHLIHLERGI